MNEIKALAARIVDTAGELDAAGIVLARRVDGQPIGDEVRQDVQRHLENLERLSGLLKQLGTAIFRRA
jgi:hypothetical protein